MPIDLTRINEVIAMPATKIFPTRREIQASNPPAASSLINITWDQQDTVLDAGQSIQAVLTLEAASNTGGFANFSCNVTFIGTE